MTLERDNNVLDLVKQEGFYLYEYSSVILESLKKNCQAKKIFLVPWLVEKLMTKNMDMFLRFGINLKRKRWNIITTCTSNLMFYS